MAPAASPAPDATRTVRIPEETARRIEQKLARTSFGSLDEFVGFVLARLADSPGEGGFSEEDERQLRDRLRSLGYID